MQFYSWGNLLATKSHNRGQYKPLSVPISTLPVVYSPWTKIDPEYQQYGHSRHRGELQGMVAEH